MQFQYSSDGGTTWNNAGAAETSGPFSFTFSSALADGIYEARAIATDNAGNSTTSSVVPLHHRHRCPDRVDDGTGQRQLHATTTSRRCTATAADNSGGSGLASVQFQYSSNGGTTWNNAGRSGDERTVQLHLHHRAGRRHLRGPCRRHRQRRQQHNLVRRLLHHRHRCPDGVDDRPDQRQRLTNNNKPTLYGDRLGQQRRQRTGQCAVPVQQQRRHQLAERRLAAWTAAPFSFTFTTALATGSYEARAVATDNAGNSTTSAVVSFGVNVIQAKPTLSIATGGTVVVGSPNKLTASATLSKGSKPTGTITFTLYGPDGKTVIDTEPATVNGNGTYKTPNGYLPTAAGTYQWVASYTGDIANKAATSSKAAEIVSMATPTVPPSPGGPVVLGTGIRLTCSATLVERL